MDQIQDLILELDDSRATIKSLLAQLSEDEEVYPRWKVKELVAHLAGWDDATIAALEAHLHGEPTPMLAARGINVYNAATVEERQALDYAQIYQEWEKSRQTLKDLLRQMPAEKLDVVFTFPWGENGTVADLIHVMSEHEVEHTHEIRQQKHLPETQG